MKRKNYTKGDFKTDNEIATMFELFVAKKLVDEGYCERLIRKSDGNFPEWDLRMYLKRYNILFENFNDELYFEVKSDFYKTGNIIFEFESKKNRYSSVYDESGINVTTSDYWVIPFYYFNEIWVFKTDKVKSIIKSCLGESNLKWNNDTYMKRRPANKGKTHVYLFSKQDFISLMGKENIYIIETNMKSKMVERWDNKYTKTINIKKGVIK